MRIRHIDVRRILRKTGFSLVAAAMLAVSVMLSAAPTDADAHRRVVAADGNLWGFFSESDLTRITPQGDRTSFPLGPNRFGEAVAAGPGSDISVIDFTDSMTVRLRRFSTTTDSWRSGSVDLTSTLKFGNLGRPRMSVDANDTTWIAESWDNCVSPTPGALISVTRDGHVERSPVPFRGPDDQQLYLRGHVLAAPGGQLWMNAMTLNWFDCEGYAFGYGYSGKIIRRGIDGSLHETRCQAFLDGRESPFVSDSTGHVWCFEYPWTVYRYDPDGSATSYLIPESETVAGMQSPNVDRDGNLWFLFARQQPNGDGSQSGGVFQPVSISPDGTFRTYDAQNTFHDDWIQPGSYRYSAAKGWVMSPDGHGWTISGQSTGDGSTPVTQQPAVAVISASPVLEQPLTTYRYTPDGTQIKDPGQMLPPPNPVPPGLNAQPSIGSTSSLGSSGETVQRPKRLAATLRVTAPRSKRTLRRNRAVRVTTTASRPSRVTVTVSVSNRDARRLKLRHQSSRATGRFTIKRWTRRSVNAGTPTVFRVTLKTAVARRIIRAKQKVSLRVGMTATSGRDVVGQTRTITIK